MTRAVFAIPGDKNRRTGGFIYEATVLRVLNEIGCTTAHLQLPDSFPDPTAADMDQTLNLLRAVPPDQPVILDGLVFGAIDPRGLATVRAPVIAMIHHPLGLENGLAADRAAFLMRNEAAALRHAARVIVPSAETARILCSQFGASADRITIAPPGFDRPAVDPQPADPPLILSVGLLAPRKGHDVLLNALAGIADLPWRAEIVGRAHDQATADALYAQARALRLEPRVRFAGEVGPKALRSLYNEASVFTLATRYEGYGMVLSEAMMYGLPVVSCATGAVPDTVGDAGILVPPDDAEAFATALRHILTDPHEKRRLADLSARRSATLPRWRDTAEIFSAVISGVKGA
ncbi:glycosyltransferase family 4 protein [Roseobacter sp.]|uniref:glycosyltransferase family 4 protein n=1 Tax=Roseobacter sp. TaxID=1907202 RepID=UPI0025E19480|nr:glycosyltransferase family 4 protein [Roseobacter sp.]